MNNELNWDETLVQACKNGDLNLVKYVSDRGARANDDELDWDMGLRAAASRGHIQVGEYMIERGATAWKWALERSCKHGHLNFIKLIVKKVNEDEKLDVYDIVEHLEWGIRNARDLHVVRYLYEQQPHVLNMYINSKPKIIERSLPHNVLEYFQEVDVLYYPRNNDLHYKNYDDYVLKKNLILKLLNKRVHDLSKLF